jgi:hypothetical protein
MRRLTLILALAAAGPARAEDAAPAPADPPAEGFDLMQQGAELLMEGIMDEMAPAIEEFRDMAEDLAPAFGRMSDEMGQALVRLFDMIDDVTHYQLPEFLPNGDIIIRRAPDAPPWKPPADAPGMTDL